VVIGGVVIILMMTTASDVQISEKSESQWRWVILVVGCFMMIGEYFATDVPAALYTQLKDYMGSPDDFALNFGIIYSLDSTPNLVVPFFAGYLSDRFCS
jgi:MFS family permease